MGDPAFLGSQGTEMAETPQDWGTLADRTLILLYFSCFHGRTPGTLHWLGLLLRDTRGVRIPGKARSCQPGSVSPSLSLYPSSVAPKTCPHLPLSTPAPRFSDVSLSDVSEPQELLVGPVPWNVPTRGPRTRLSCWAPGSLSQGQPLPGDKDTREAHSPSWPSCALSGGCGSLEPPQPHIQRWGCSKLQVLFSAQGDRPRGPLGSVEVAPPG